MMLAPRPTALNLGSLAAPSNGQGSTATSPLEGPMPRFPHVRAALSAIAKQYKPTELDDEAGGDDLNRVNTATVSKVVNLLEEEDEDQLQALLKETYAILDDTEVCLATDQVEETHADYCVLRLQIMSSSSCMLSATTRQAFRSFISVPARADPSPAHPPAPHHTPCGSQRAQRRPTRASHPVRRSGWASADPTPRSSPRSGCLSRART